MDLRVGKVWYIWWDIPYHIISYRSMGRYRGESHQITSKDIGWEITNIMKWCGKFLIYAGVSHNVDYFPYQVADKIRKSGAE